MLYTRKGDNGTTKLFDSPPGKRISKSAFIFEVLGVVDELNSSLGYAKSLLQHSSLRLVTSTGVLSYEEILGMFQQTLFVIQAEVGGSQIRVVPEQVLFIESVIYEVETLLPPVTSFVVPGGGIIGSYFDVVRTIARRAERKMVLLRGKGERSIGSESICFLNRLSSALYALARFANYQEGYIERRPTYG